MDIINRHVVIFENLAGEKKPTNLQKKLFGKKIEL